MLVVVLQQTREQSQRLQQLQDKVQTIENANDLERTNALEEQLRSTVERLQALEGIEQKVQSLSIQVQTLRDLQREFPRFPYDSQEPRLRALPALPQLP